MICIRISVVFNIPFIIVWWYLFNNFIYNCLWSFYFICFVYFYCLLKYGNSFRNSSSHIIFAGLFFSLLLNGSLGCCGTVFTYCISGSCFILFFCFQRSRECSGTFLIYSMPLLWFLFFCISFFLDNIWGKWFFLSVWFLIKLFLLRRLSLSLGCKGVFLINLTSSL